MLNFRVSLVFPIIALATLFIYQSPLSAEQIDYSKRPVFLGEKIIKHYYDGEKDDLLTAGLTFKELSERKLSQSIAEASSENLRKLAYFNNTLALVDTTEAGGYGQLFGPAKTQSPVSGYQYLSYSLNENGQLDATLMLQVPDSFDHEKNCLIVAASSGSRGIYGAVSTVGTWALVEGCAIAYTDKGTGTGFYLFDEKSGYSATGVYQRNSDDDFSGYSESLTDKKRDFLKSYPGAIATKQAHSQDNVERKFGEYVYQAARFALYQLDQHFAGGARFNKDNTRVIAASISNGGVASLKAGEFDRDGLFDAIVVSEPNIYPPKDGDLEIIKSGQKVTAHSIPGFNYFIAQNLYSPCTLLTPTVSSRLATPRTKQQQKFLNDWCLKLKADKFIAGKTPSQLAKSSLNELRKMGIEDNQQILSPIMDAFKVWPSLAITYTNQVGRYQFGDNPCGMFFSAVDKAGQSRLLSKSERALLFANSNGIPPTAGVSFLSQNSDMTQYDQAKCFYKLAQSERIQQGVEEIVATGDLHNIPTIIIHGQNDNLIAPNHTSRAYYGSILNKRQHDKDKIRYYEITNTQHFDAFLTIPAFAQEYVPLHYYFEQSLELMMNYLYKNKPLPPSQLVKTQTRQHIDGKLEPLMKKHLTPISEDPDNPIVLKGNQLVIP